MKIIWVVVIGVASYALGCVTGCIANRDANKAVQTDIQKMTDEFLKKNQEVK